MEKMGALESDAVNIEGKIEPDDIPIVKPKGFGQRHTLTFLLFLAVAISFSFRIILSVTIIEMTRNSTDSAFQRMDWDESTQGIIFGSNFWGVFLSTSIAGITAQRFGAKIPLLIAIFGMSLVAIATPVIAPLGWIWMCVRQLTEGLLAGFVLPATHYLMGRWIHPVERTLLVGLVFTGVFVGKISSLILTGFLISSSLGWPSSFYIHGILGIMWSIAWWIYGSNSPLKNSRITNDERAFLQTIPGMTMEKLATPWRSIVTSKPVWALIICQCCQNWCWIMVWVSLPTYFHSILHFNIRTSSLLTGTTYGTGLVFTIISSILATWLIQKGYTSVPASRKIFNTCGMWIPGVLIFILAFFNEDIVLASFLVILFIGINGVVVSGYSINNLDLTTNFSGPVSSFTGCCGTVSSIISPIFYGYVVSDVNNPKLWRLYFLSGAVSYFLGNLGFLTLARFTVQPWNSGAVKAKTKPLLK